MEDPSFRPPTELLARAAARAAEMPAPEDLGRLPEALPAAGLGEAAALDLLAGPVLGGAARLGGAEAFAHMDPPTPWIAWVLTLWNASRNQNLLHPATAPVARAAEARVVGWLAPVFGMDGGHLCAGSTLANLTALWSAREIAGARRVVASAAAHVSVQKSAAILGLGHETVPTDAAGRMALPADAELDDACLVLTAGTTGTGAVDPLALAGRAAWTHVDAAWAGALRLSPRHSRLLDGIERADSVALSSHKWLFQPKDQSLVLFRDTARAHGAVSFGGSYLAAPNVGVQGSRGAAAVVLLGTLLAWGHDGIGARIDRCMAAAEALAEGVAARPGLALWRPPVTGVVNFRAPGLGTDALLARLPAGMLSRTEIDGAPWLRAVAANPEADSAAALAALDAALA